MRRILLCLVLAVLPLAALAQEAPAGPTSTIATAIDATQDADIAVRIREILQELGGYRDVTVTVAQGIVTFRGTTDTATQAETLTPLAGRVEGVVAVKNQVAETHDLARRLSPAMERFQSRLARAWTSLPLFLIALAAFALLTTLGWLLASWRKPWDRLAPNSFIAGFYRQILQIAFIVGAIVVALDILDASALLGTIFGAAGILGLAIAFAVRDTVENYIASLLLSIRQPFRPNDAVEINGDEGKVIRLTSRATILLSWDGNQIRIPNATVYKSRIVNFTQNAKRRFTFTLTIAAHSDLMRAVTLAGQTVQGLPFVQTVPGAQAWLGDPNPAGIAITVAGWIDQRQTSILRARGEAMRQVMLAFADAGIEMHEATYRLKIDGALSAGVPEGARLPAPKPHQAQPAAAGGEVAQVGSDNEGELEVIIAAERDKAQSEDLLTPTAKQE